MLTITTPKRSITRYDSAVRLPSALAPIADSSTGTAAPMAIPIIIGNATSKLTAPVMASACKMPTAADALCKTLVKTSPTRIPRMGFEKSVIIPIKFSSDLSPETAPLIAFMPNIKTAKPISMPPTWRFDISEENIYRIMPMSATIEVRVSVDRSSSQPEELPPISERQIIQPVTLVPIIAPIIMPIAWRTFIISEFTKPTTITEVADDDCITAVTPVPSRMPFS